MKIKINNLQEINNIDRFDYVLLKEDELNNKDIIKRLKKYNIKIGAIASINELKYFLENVEFLDFFQLRTNELIDAKIANEIKSNKKEIIYSRNLECDEDPFWLLPVNFDKKMTYEEIIKYCKYYNILIEINLFANTKIENQIEYLLNECGKYSDDLTIKELESFLKNIKAFLCIKSKNDLSKVKRVLSSLYGVSLDCI